MTKVYITNLPTILINVCPTNTMMYNEKYFGKVLPNILLFQGSM